MSDEDTPELWEVIDAAIASFADQLLVGLPGVITDYDEDGNTVSAQAVVMHGEFGEDGSRASVPIATFTDVPIGWPGGMGKRLIKWPIKKGDQCWLHFSGRCLNSWKANGTKIADPLDDRRHHKADVMCIPGQFIRPKDGDAIIEFTDDGKIDAGGSELLALKQDVSALKSALDTFMASLATAVGGISGSGSAAGAAITTAAGQFNTTLASWPTGTSKLRGG